MRKLRVRIACSGDVDKRLGAHPALVENGFNDLVVEAIFYRQLVSPVERKEAMRWMMRLAVFTLSISLGASACYILAQRKAETLRKVEGGEEMLVRQGSRLETVGTNTGALEESIHFAPAGPMYGYINRGTVILRESPAAGARVVAKLKIEAGDSAEILGATRDFIQVKFAAHDDSNGDEKRERDYEGWTDWKTVTPGTAAIILDADTGMVVSRIPVGNGLSSVAYSPDGERATFYGGEESLTAYEVRTSDYTRTRSFVSTTPNTYGAFFYAPSDGALYAAVLTRSQNHESEPTKLSIVRIGDESITNTSRELSVEAEDFSVAPDGLTGFILHGEDRDKREMKVDVLDLSTLRVHNSFTLRGDSLPQSASVFVVNRDGTELYARLNDQNSVSVVDTRTGQVQRVLSFDSRAKDYWYFDRGDLVGDSLLLRVWNQGEDEMHTPPHAFWLGSNGRLEAEPGISCAVQATGARYAVNEKGTVLLKLDSNNHVRSRFKIERPDLEGSDGEDGLSVFGLSASPDGRRIILVVGIEDGC